MNPYLIRIVGRRGTVNIEGELFFEEPANQPGSGTPLVAQFTAPNGPASPSVLVPNTLIGGAPPSGVPASATRTAAPINFGAGVIVGGGDVSLRLDALFAPPGASNLDIGLTAFVTNADGSNRANISVGYSIVAPVSAVAHTYDLTTGTWDILAGGDLSDGGDGNLLSAAGDIYTVVATISAGWD